MQVKANWQSTTDGNFSIRDYKKFIQLPAK